MTASSDETTGTTEPVVSDELAGAVTVALPPRRDAVGKPRPVRRAPLAVAASINALWAAVVSFVPMLGTVAAVTLIGPNRPPLGPTVRFAIGGWLLAHGVPLAISGEPLSLVPLAVAALAAWRCARAGRNTMRAIGARRSASVRPALAVAATIAIGYGLLGALMARLASGPDLRAGVLRAGLTLAIFSGLASLFGALRASGTVRRWRVRVPRLLRDATRTAVVAVLVLVGLGAVAVGATIATAGSAATASLGGMHLGFAADAGIVLVCLAYAPNLAVWAAAFLAGPGFTLAQVPALPVFAGLPGSPITGIGQVLLVTPVLAGAVAGALLARRRRRLAAEALAARALARARSRPAGGADTPDGDPGRWSAIYAALLAAPFAGLLIAAAGYLAAGALGSGPLASTGQVGWAFAVIGGIGVGFGATLAATITEMFPRA